MRHVLVYALAAALASPVIFTGCEESHHESESTNPLTGTKTTKEQTTYQNPMTGDTSTQEKTSKDNPNTGSHSENTVNH